MVACMFKKPVECGPGLQSFAVRRDKQAEAEGPLSNVCFKVYDKVRILVDTTSEFPLDLKCTLLLTKTDMETYDELKAKQDKRIVDAANLVLQEIEEGEV